MKPAAPFPLPLRLERVGPLRAALIEPFSFESPTLGRVEIPAGFVTDYASVPRLFWSLYPPDGSYTPAAVVHDWLYASQVWQEHGTPLVRAQADTVFLEAMKACGVSALRRRLLYAAVRAGGRAAWRRSRPADMPDLPARPLRLAPRGPRH